jgi:hypothetical protein
MRKVTTIVKEVDAIVPSLSQRREEAEKEAAIERERREGQTFEYHNGELWSPARPTIVFIGNVPLASQCGPSGMNTSGRNRPGVTPKRARRATIDRQRGTMEVASSCERHAVPAMFKALKQDVGKVERA